MIVLGRDQAVGIQARASLCGRMVVMSQSVNLVRTLWRIETRRTCLCLLQGAVQEPETLQPAKVNWHSVRDELSGLNGPVDKFDEVAAVE